jgi:hypothetical protein
MPGEVMEEKVGLGEWPALRREKRTFQKVIVLMVKDTSCAVEGRITQVGDWWHVCDLRYPNKPEIQR